MGLAVRQSQKGHTFGCGLDIGVGVQLKKVKVSSYLA